MASKVSNLQLRTHPNIESSYPFHDLNEIHERILVMKLQENNTYAPSDYLQKVRDESPVMMSILNFAKDDIIDEECREKMVTWCYQVVDFIKIRREAVETAFRYLDRFLSSEYPVALDALKDRKLYQLAAMVSLSLAVKLNEPVIMHTSILVDLSHGSYKDHDFVQMETDILSALNWKVNGPLAQDFAQHFFAIIPKDKIDRSNILNRIKKFTSYQIQISVADHFFVKEKPSAIALSSILNALQGISMDELPMRNRLEILNSIRDLTKFDPQSEELVAIRLRLLECVNTEVITESMTRIKGACKMQKNSSSEYSSCRHDSSPSCVSKHK